MRDRGPHDRGGAAVRPLEPTRWATEAAVARGVRDAVASLTAGFPLYAGRLADDAD